MISIKEFQDYVDSFHKNKGEYTISDLLSIGVKFKQLPLKQRNWNTLHQMLGVYGFSSEAYRKKVEKYIKTCSDVLDPETRGELYKNDFSEKQQVRDWYNAYRRTIREEVRIENLKDEIAKAAEKFKDLPPVKYDGKEKATTLREAVLLLSDLHIGVECDNYYNKYNINVARERLGKLLKETIEYCRLNKVGTLHVINLGDMIQGLIHTNARIEAQMDVAEQIMVAGELVSDFMNQVQLAAPKVTYRSVFDNHSRAVANLGEHVEKEQFSRIIDWFIKERLKATKIEFLENKIDGGIGQLYLGNGKNVMFAHGHQDGRNNSFQNFIGLTKEWVDYIFLAHYHNPASKDYQGCKVFINGSIVGTESYAFGRRLFTKPSQKLLIFETDSENILDIDINLG